MDLVAIGFIVLISSVVVGAIFIVLHAAMDFPIGGKLLPIGVFLFFCPVVIFVITWAVCFCRTHLI